MNAISAKALADTINAVVYTVLSKHLLVDMETIGPESHLIRDLYADSMDLLDIYMQISEAVDVDLDTQALSEVRKVGELCEAVCQAVREKR